MKFGSPEEELAFLRGLVRVTQLADEILEDCLARQLGLSSAIDTFLAQTARMIHARAGFVQLRGSGGPVLTRVLGNPGVDVNQAAGWDGVVPLTDSRSIFVSPLKLASVELGAFALVVDGRFNDSGEAVMALVRAISEQLDSAVLGFMALGDGSSPLERLDELNEANGFRPRGRIGRYELVTPLGTGGMAQVMVARTVGPEGLGRLVALKRILPHLTAEPEIVQQFLDEARIGLRLSHPNLVTFHDFGQAGGTYYIAMELVRGADLDHWIRASSGPLPANFAVGVIAQALAGLHAAHEARAEDGSLLGLVHRDLSPQNLVVGFDGVVKILDFGVAKARCQRTVTLPGIVKGKPVYMSPEQAAGERVDRRSDLFAMAIILYEALTGVLPFDKGDDTRSMEAIVSDPAPANPLIPAPIWEVLSTALAKDPAQRFRTAAEMRTRLLEVHAAASEVELGRAITSVFPDRLREFTRWDRPQPHEDVAKVPTRLIRSV